MIWTDNDDSSIAAIDTLGVWKIAAHRFGEAGWLAEAPFGVPLTDDDRIRLWPTRDEAKAAAEAEVRRLVDAALGAAEAGSCKGATETMTPEQKAAYVTAQAVSALAAIAGMQAANHERIQDGYALAYPESAFADVTKEFCISHDAVVAFFQEPRT